MEQEIRDVIEKQLPAQVGAVLAKRLEQADKDAAEVERLKKIVADNLKFSDIQGEEIKKLRIELAKHDALEAREAAVTKREQSIELDIAKGRADNAERNKMDLFNLVGLVFKSPVTKETILKNENVQVPGSGGYPVNVPQSATTTITREVD